MSAWTMRGEYGIDTDMIEPGDWLRVWEGNGHRWAQVQTASPTAPDLAPNSMDVSVIYEGERKRQHYRIPSGNENHWFKWAGQHRPVCAHCGKGWPCEPVQMQRQFLRESTEQGYRCVVCNRRGGNTMTVNRQTPDGVVRAQYHTAKSRTRCRRELVKVASEQELASLRYSDSLYERKAASRG